MSTERRLPAVIGVPCCFAALSVLGACSSGPGSDIISAPSKSGPITLSWQPPSSNTNGSPLTDLAGYTIAYGTNPGLLTQSIKVGSPTTTSYTLPALPSGVWYFAVSAYNSAGAESLPTRTLRVKIKASPSAP